MFIYLILILAMLQLYENSYIRGNQKMKVGYDRVSIDLQNLDLQIDALETVMQKNIYR